MKCTKKNWKTIGGRRYIEGNISSLGHTISREGEAQTRSFCVT